MHINISLYTKIYLLILFCFNSGHFSYVAAKCVYFSSKYMNTNPVVKKELNLYMKEIYLSCEGQGDPIPLQVKIYRRLRIGRDGHRDQSEAYDTS